MTFPLNFMNDSMISIEAYIELFAVPFPGLQKAFPWNIPSRVERILVEKIKTLSSEYSVNNGIAIHKTARIEEHVTLKGPMIISEGCFIGAHAYLRGGVFLGDQSVIGPGCEVKSSMILQQSALAHFNFVGDSLLGSNVNLEAGSIIANHFNERYDKTIYALINGKKTNLGRYKIRCDCW